MNVLHHHLEAIEASSLRNLNLGGKSLSKVLKHNSVRSSEEGENHFNEVSLIVIKLLPVLEVLSKIDFFSGPEAGHLVFVHLPDVVISDG